MRGPHREKRRAANMACALLQRSFHPSKMRIRNETTKFGIKISTVMKTDAFDSLTCWNEAEQGVLWVGTRNQYHPQALFASHESMNYVDSTVTIEMRDVLIRFWTYFCTTKEEPSRIKLGLRYCRYSRECQCGLIGNPRFLIAILVI